MPQESKLWPLNIFCSKCGTETIYKRCEYASTGKICFISFCPICEKYHRTETSGEELRKLAIEANTRARKCKTTPPSQQETEEDAKFLKKCFIKPP